MIIIEIGISIDVFHNRSISVREFSLLKSGHFGIGQSDTIPVEITVIKVYKTMVVFKSSILATYRYSMCVFITSFGCYLSFVEMNNLIHTDYQITNFHRSLRLGQFWDSVMLYQFIPIDKQNLMHTVNYQMSVQCNLPVMPVLMPG